jgi:hypothetical protein
MPLPHMYKEKPYLRGSCGRRRRKEVAGKKWVVFVTICLL